MRALLLGFALVLAAPTARATPLFVGLGDLTGGVFESFAHDASADGSVVVGVSRSASGVEAFRWTASGGMVGLGDLPGGEFHSTADGVSADGSVVVGTGRLPRVGGSIQQQAFRWTSEEGMVGLGELPGGEVESIATGISADGSAIVGGSGSGSSAGPEAFRWTATDGMVGLGGLPGNSVVSGAHGVSADGSVVVGHALKSFSPVYGAEVPFRWTQAGGMVDLGPMPEGTAGFASAASGDGSVVVGDAGNAFRWTEGSGMVGLGNTPSEAFTHTVAWDVSADGSVIVGNGSTANGAAAFIWDSNHGMRLLRDVLVNDYGLDLIGWDLSSASAVSADGRTIVGGGINPSGLQEAWIAVLPEPSTGLLFALGLAGFAGSRRRFV